MNRSDGELVAELLDDPERGLSEIIGEYSGYVCAVVRNRLWGSCTEEDMEEAVSDAFAALYRNRFRIDLSCGTLKAYLGVIAARAAVSKFRRSPFSPADISLDAEDAPDLPAPEDAEAEAEIRDRRERLMAAVKSLGEPDSTIILRKYWLGESDAEAARAVGLTANAAAKRRRRALERLRELLGEEQL